MKNKLMIIVSILVLCAALVPGAAEAEHASLKPQSRFQLVIGSADNGCADTADCFNAQPASLQGKTVRNGYHGFAL